MGLCLPEGGLPDLFVELGQLTAEGDAPLRAEGVHEVVQRRAQLVGGFVEDDGPLFTQKLSKTLFFLLPVHRQEALEHPAGGVLARDGQRRHAGGRRRDRHDFDAPGQRVPHDDLARVRDAGHSGVRAEGAVLARLNTAQDTLAFLQCVLVVADHRLFQAQIVQQPHGHAGVLGGHEVRRAEGGGHAGRHVVQIADGGCHDIKNTGHD